MSIGLIMTQMCQFIIGASSIYSQFIGLARHMTIPAHRSKKAAAISAQYRQLWPLIALVVLAVIISLITADAQWLIAKGAAAGAVLSFVAQSAFTVVAYHTVGARYAKQIMLNTYLGMAIKWLISIVGFALIFLVFTPIHAPSVIAGFIFMQISQVIGLMRLK